MAWHGTEASRGSQKGYHPTPSEEPELLEEKMDENQAWTRIASSI